MKTKKLETNFLSLNEIAVYQFKKFYIVKRKSQYNWSKHIFYEGYKTFWNWKSGNFYCQGKTIKEVANKLAVLDHTEAI